MRRRDNPIVADHGTWIEVDIGTDKHPVAIMKIDKADWDIIRATYSGRIYVARPKGSSYPYAHIYINGSAKMIHSLIYSESPCVDHIRHDGLDNRRSNIRPCSYSQNRANQRVRKDSSSGHKGVWWNSKLNKWRAKITVSGHQIHLGYFTDIFDAISARKVAEDEYQGEFAYNGNID